MFLHKMILLFILTWITCIVMQQANAGPVFDSVQTKNLTVTNTTQLNTSLSGFLRAASGLVSSQALISLTTDVSGTLPIANGGTNSSTALVNGRAMRSNGGGIVESAVTINAGGDLGGIGNLTATGITTLNTGLTGPLRASSGVISTGATNLASEVTGILPIANGGTGSGTQNFVDLTTSQTAAGSKTWTSEGEFQAQLSYAQTTDAVTTGLNQTLPLPSTIIYRVTNASLDSIDMIVAPIRSQVIVLVNHTGSSLDISNNTGATPANRILTGTGAFITMGDEASISLVYDTTEARWIIIGSSGGSVSAANVSFTPYLDIGSTNVQDAIEELQDEKQALLNNSAGLLAALSDETGTGLAVFSISPALTGSPTATTASQGDNSTRIATTAYTDTGLATKVSLTGNESIADIKNFTGRLETTSTTNSSRPCPSMDTTQRDALSGPANGDCINNTTTNSHQRYNGTAWENIGGGVTTTQLNAKRIFFRATSNNGQTCFTNYTGGESTTAQFTRIEFEDEEVDTDGLYDPSTGRFTVTSTTTGNYRCCATVKSASQDIETAGDSATLALVKNAAASITDELDFEEVDDPNAGKNWGLGGCTQVDLTTNGDFVEIYGGHNDASTGCLGNRYSNRFYCERVDGKDF